MNMNYVATKTAAATVVSEYEFHPKLRVYTIGGKRGHPLSTALLLAKANGLVHQSVLRPSRSPQGRGFKCIVPLQANVTYGDGVLVPSTGAVSVESKDCPIVVLYNYIRGRTVVCHAGRSALSRKYPSDTTVLDAAIQAVTDKPTDRQYTKAYVTAGICGHCFEHAGKDDEQYLAPFRKLHPGAIGPRGQLSLRAIILAELQELGLMVENIAFDHACTREHPLLSSHRDCDEYPNHTLVLQHN